MPTLISIEMNGVRLEMPPKTTGRKFRLSCPCHEAFRAFLRMGTVSSIVIYEADDLMRALLKEWLSQAGYRVLEAGPRGAKGEHPEDLVIVSVYMPKQAGVQLRNIRAAHPGAPLIAISGQFRSGLPAAGMAARMLGVQRVLAKPLERCDLLEAVRSVIGGSG
jgi:DNA-binding response OmpR family regulator